MFSNLFDNFYKKMNTNQKWEVQEWLREESNWLYTRYLENFNIQ